MNQVGAGFLILQKTFKEPHCKIKLNRARAG